MNKFKILIVSYKLGTESGVGGRRWLHYGLELIKKGYNVSFLTFQESIPLELKPYSGVLQSIKSNYPSVLKSYPQTIFEKILYRFWIFKLNLLNKGSVFDETARMEKTIVDTIVTSIKTKGMDCLIISGAPFSLLYYGTLVKQKFPGIKLISDYRDSWTQGTGYGIKRLSVSKFQFELKNELHVLKNSDHILVASEDIKIALKNLAPEIPAITLQNFVELTPKAQVIDLNKPYKTGEILITHLGSVNVGTKKYWSNYLNNINSINSDGNIILKTSFVGNVNKEIEEYVKDNNIQNVEFIPRIDRSQIERHLSLSNFFIFFKHDEFPNSFPTKFFDYILARKPLICYSKEGQVTLEIRENRLGIVLNENSHYDKLLAIIDPSFPFNSTYDWSKFSLEYNVPILERILTRKMQS